MSEGQAMIDAVKSGDQEQVEELLEENPRLASAKDESGVSAILLAVYHGRREIANRLAERRDDLDLFEAVAVGNRERVSELMEAAPERIDDYAVDGFTALQLAAYFSRPEIAGLLLARGPNVNAVAQNPMKIMALHAAVAGKDAASAERITSALLDHGADVNAAQQGGFTPIHAAAMNGYTRIVEMLLARGADVNAKTEKDKTALDFATEAGHADTAALLRRHSAQAEAPSGEHL